MYCLPGAVRGFQMGWVKISVVVVTNQRNKNFHLLPILGFSKLTYYVNHTCRIFLWQREPTFSQATSNDQHTPKFHQKHHFYATIFARQRLNGPRRRQNCCRLSRTPSACSRDQDLAFSPLCW